MKEKQSDDLPRRHAEAKARWAQTTDEYLRLGRTYDSIKEIQQRVLDQISKNESVSWQDAWLAIHGEQALLDALRAKSEEWDGIRREVTRLLQARIEAGRQPENK